MNHSDIESLTANYLDGELPLKMRGRFDGHLDQCDECSQELSEMRATIKMLRTLPNPEPPSDLVDNVMARIREGQGQLAWHERIAEFFSQLAIPRFALPATAMAAGLAVVMLAGDIQLPTPGQGRAGGQSQPAGQIAMAPGAPAQANIAPTPGPRSARGESLRLAQVRAGGQLAGGSFVFRSDHQGLVPMIPQSREVGFPFDGRLQRQGPYMGARAASDSQAQLTATRVTRGGARGGVDQGLGTFVRTQPSLVGNLSVALPADAEGGLSRDDRRRLELDGRLKFLLQNPTRFAQRLGGHSLAEQELWLGQLASRAVDHGRSQQAVEALRSSGVVTADFLADTFAAAAQKSIDQRGANVASQHEVR